jgi:hypothetical protein
MIGLDPHWHTLALLRILRRGKNLVPQSQTTGQEKNETGWPCAL